MAAGDTCVVWLEKAYELSLQMDKLAGKDDWEKYAELEGQRMDFLKKAFEKPVPGELKARALELSRNIQQLIDQNQGQAVGSAKAMKKEFADLKKGIKATAAYRENMNDSTF